MGSYAGLNLSKADSHAAVYISGNLPEIHATIQNQIDGINIIARIIFTVVGNGAIVTLSTNPNHCHTGSNIRTGLNGSGNIGDGTDT